MDNELLINDVIQKRIKDLKNITNTQCQSGNWDYDPYMHGMANGMILSLSTIEGNNPEFLDAPDQWLNVSDTYEKPLMVRE